MKVPRSWLICASLMFATAADAATLRVAIPALPASLGVPFTAVGQPSTATWSALFDALTRLDPDGGLKPALASSWKAVNPRLWQFTLRADIKFHDGTALTAQGVVDSLAILRTKEAAKFYLAAEMTHLTAIRATGPLTLEIETGTPDAILPRRMSILPIVSAAAWAAKGEAGFAQAPVGTGPYKLLDWGKSSGTAKLTAAAQSWRKPATEGLELVPLDSAISRLQALMSGRVDVAARMNNEDLAPAKDGGFKVASLDAPQVLSLGFKIAGNAKSPIADVRVRQAMSMAINRPGIAAQILQGLAKPTGQAASQNTVGFSADIPVPPYDPERAKSLLKEAGYLNGLTITAEVLVGVSPADDLIYQQVVQDLSRIGVNVTLRAIPYTVWLRKYSANDWAGDMFSLTWDSSSFYDVIRVIGNASCAKPSPFFCDPALTPVIAAVDTEMDEAKRLTALKALNARYATLAPALFLVTVSHHYGYSPKIQTLNLRNSGVVYEGVTFNP